MLVLSESMTSSDSWTFGSNEVQRSIQLGDSVLFISILGIGGVFDKLLSEETEKLEENA